MKPFKPTYLYIKTHNLTGLKYFGKTTKDPLSYKGSGKYWLSHLKKYGSDVSTEILGYYGTSKECNSAAVNFSKNNDIVNSKEWANLIIENGLDGGDTNRKNYVPHSEESKKKISESKKGQTPWNRGLKGVTQGNKKPRTEEQKIKISNSLKGRKRDPESIKKTANKLRGRTRPEISKKLKGIKRSHETIEKMKIAQQNRPPVSEDTKIKIRAARKKQVITQATKEKLKGTLVVINKKGEFIKISKETYYSQVGEKQNWEYVSHRSKEAKLRKI